jgi:hypothetical protein
MVRKPERKSQLGKPRRRWQDNINIDVKQMGGKTLTGLIWLMIVTRDRLF